jgi:hypothetical protein
VWFGLVEDVSFNRKSLIGVFSLIIVAFLGLTTQASTAVAETTVFVHPEKATVKVGEIFHIYVNVSGASKLQGFDFMLSYDSRLLNCSGLDEGTFLSGFGPTFVAKREMNSSFADARGRVWFAVVIYGTGFADGNGTLAVLTFVAVSSGETVLDLYSDYPLNQGAVKLTTCFGQAIPNKAFDILLTVVEAGPGDPPPADGNPDPPSPDVNGDGVVDMKDLTIVAVAYGTVEGDLKYDAKADLDQNGKVDILDVALVAHYYMRKT